MENDETKKDLGMSPPPMLLVSKSNKDHFEYIPQIHADEQGQLNVNLNNLKETETKEESKVEVLNDSYNKNEDFRLGNSSIMENHPLTKTEKKAIKLITVPDEKENFQNPNPQEMESPSLDFKNQSNDMNLNESKFDSPGLSPNSLPISRKKSILKGSPNLKAEAQRFDAEGNMIGGDDKRHRISFRADLYQINEVESYKNMHNNDFLKKCCKFCTIQ